jgi:hypothetical protein
MLWFIVIHEDLEEGINAIYTPLYSRIYPEIIPVSFLFSSLPFTCYDEACSDFIAIF